MTTMTLSDMPHCTIKSRLADRARQSILYDRDVSTRRENVGQFSDQVDSITDARRYSSVPAFDCYLGLMMAREDTEPWWAMRHSCCFRSCALAWRFMGHIIVLLWAPLDALRIRFRIKTGSVILVLDLLLLRAWLYADSCTKKLQLQYTTNYLSSQPPNMFGRKAMTLHMTPKDRLSFQPAVKMLEQARCPDLQRAVQQQ